MLIWVCGVFEKPAGLSQYMTDATFDLASQWIDDIVFGADWPNPLFNYERYYAKANELWDYVDGCMLTAMMDAYDYSKNTKFLSRVTGYYDHYIDKKTLAVNGWKTGRHELDSYPPARTLIQMYEITGDAMYREVADEFYNELTKTYPRNSEKSFYHKAKYPNQVWLDGLYMGLPFYALYANAFGNQATVYDDILLQFRNVHKHLLNASEGLYYHGYDLSSASSRAAWADSVTFHNKAFWSRSITWYAMAAVDVHHVAAAGTLKDELTSIAKEVLLGLIRHLDSDTSMLWQVPDCKGQKSNYLETSSSAQLCYAILRAVEDGILGSEYVATAAKIFNGLTKKYLSVVGGQARLEGICLSAGLTAGSSSTTRDGTYDYYVGRPTVRDDAKGSAFFLMSFVHLLKAAAKKA